MIIYIYILRICIQKPNIRKLFSLAFFPLLLSEYQTQPKCSCDDGFSVAVMMVCCLFNLLSQFYIGLLLCRIHHINLLSTLALPFQYWILVLLVFGYIHTFLWHWKYFALFFWYLLKYCWLLKPYYHLVSTDLQGVMDLEWNWITS